MVFLIALIFSLKNVQFINKNLSTIGYIYEIKPNMAKIFASSFGTCLVLMNSYVPLTINVIIEIVKGIYVRQLQRDA